MSGDRTDCCRTVLRRAYFPLLLRGAPFIVALWLAVLVAAALLGPRFLSQTKTDFTVPAGTDADRADKAFARAFPNAATWPPLFVVQHTDSLPTIVGDGTRSVAAALAKFADDHAAVVSGVSGYWEIVADNPGLLPLALALVSADNRTMLSQMSFTKGATLGTIDAVIADFIPLARSLSVGGVGVSGTGLLACFHDMEAATQNNIAEIDEVVLPIALLILGWRVRSYRHILIALVTLAVTVLLAFTVMLPIAAATAIDPFAPSIMMSLSTAVSFDYSLFLLARFREERVERGQGKVEAVFAALETAGHVVLLSGTTLLATFVLLLFFPQAFLRSVGWGCAAVVLSAMLCSLTLTPALLLWLDCLSTFELLPYEALRCCLRRRAGATNTDEHDDDGGVLSGSDDNKAGGGRGRSELAPLLVAPADTAAPHSMTGEGGPPPTASLWFRIAWAVTGRRAKWAVLAATVAVIAPCCVALARLRPTSDDNLVFLQGSDSFNALTRLRSDFAVGAIDPYSLLLASTGASGADIVLTPAYFDFESRLVHRLLETQARYLDADSITALSFYDGADVTFAESQRWLFDAAAPDYNSTRARSYRTEMADGRINDDASAALVALRTLVQPDTQAAVPFIEATRELLAAYPAAPPELGGLGVHLFGSYTSTLDIQNALYALVPTEVAAVASLALLIVGASFGSLLLVVRLAFTVFASLCATFGLAALVYVPGVVQDALKPAFPSLAVSSGVYFVIPPMVISILVGLGLDYDIFLMSRAVELRKLGWSDRAAICLAVEKTGGVITSAGLIMAVSFAGLFTLRATVLNQYGFVLFVGVVVDTFIVRPILVPAAIAAASSARSVGDGGGVLARLNWWPRRMPPPRLDPAAEAVAVMSGVLPDDATT